MVDIGSISFRHLLVEESLVKISVIIFDLFQHTTVSLPIWNLYVLAQLPIALAESEFVFVE